MVIDYNFGKLPVRRLSSVVFVTRNFKVNENAFKEFVFGGLRASQRRISVLQDEAPCDRANATNIWLRHYNLEVLEWPPCFFVSNFTENLWRIIVRRMYRHGKYYKYKKQLMNGILKQ